MLLQMEEIVGEMMLQSFKKIILQEIVTLIIFVFQYIAIGNVQKLPGIVISEIRRKIFVFNTIKGRNL